MFFEVYFKNHEPKVLNGYSVTEKEGTVQEGLLARVSEVVYFSQIMGSKQTQVPIKVKIYEAGWLSITVMGKRVSGVGDWVLSGRPSTPLGVV